MFECPVCVHHGEHCHGYRDEKSYDEREQAENIQEAEHHDQAQQLPFVPERYATAFAQGGRNIKFPVDNQIGHEHEAQRPDDTRHDEQNDAGDDNETDEKRRDEI